MKKTLVVVAALYLIALITLYFFQEKLLFITEQTPIHHQYSYKHPHTERYFLNKRKEKIHGLHFKKRDSLGVILYFHGNAFSLESWGGIYENFRAYPYDFIIVDYRGFGKSQGSLSSENYFFDDAQVIYDEVKREYNEENIVVYGRSLGSSCASYLAANNAPKLVILETPFYSLVNLINEKMPFIPSSLIKYLFNNDQYLKKSKSPIHLIHGTKDELIPFHHSVKLHAIIKGKGSFTKVVDGTHNDLSRFATYKKRIQYLLEANHH